MKYGIHLTDDEIQSLSKHKFQQIVNKAVDKFAFSQLINEAKNQSKCRQIVDSIDEANMKMQEYLICDNLVKEEQLLLFQLRSPSFPVKMNF